MHKISLIILISGLLFFQNLAAAGVISDIRFAGNVKTKEYILRQELTIKQGDDLNPEELERSRQFILDLGLFRSVKVEVLEGRVVLFTVKEKRYLLLLPRFSRDSNSDKISPGITLTMDNIGGKNQSLEFLLKRSNPDDASYGHKDEFSIAYRYPKIFGTQYSIDTLLAFSRQPLQVLSAGIPVAEYRRQEVDVRFNVTRWVKKIGPSSGWVIGAGPRLRFSRYKYDAGLTGVYEDDQSISLLGQVFFTDIHDHVYSRTGKNYGYVFEQGIKTLGSDYNYNRHLFFYRQFLRLGKPHHNLNWQVRLGLSNGRLSNLNRDAFKVGGYGNLRAYDPGLVGDAFMILNVEYLQPVFDSNQVRGLVFLDAGNAFDRNTDLSLSGLKLSTGLGLRWKIKSFVNLQFSLEYAYNVDTGDNKVYLRSSGPF
ncbi:MAG: BamA/TamA family outer membrane protein [Gammaproteobacteria bacterium]|nr:BamA/TamA family outer membrane protein [Gammaproteobacteria bacterium]